MFGECHDVFAIRYNRFYERAGELPRRGRKWRVLRDFKDMVYPFFESYSLFLECLVYIVVICFAILRIEGCLNSTL